MSRPCPRCARPTSISSDNPDRPFCSERCRLADLGAWLVGDYTIPGDAADDEDVEQELRAGRKTWSFE